MPAPISSRRIILFPAKVKQRILQEKQGLIHAVGKSGTIQNRHHTPRIQNVTFRYERFTVANVKVG